MSPDPTALAAWVAERKAEIGVHIGVDLDAASNERLACLDVIEAAATVEHDGGNGVLHAYGQFEELRYLVRECALCAALHHLTQGES